MSEIPPEGIRIPMQEAVLKLWQQQCDARTIMEICKISENDLEAIVPQKLWFDIAMVQCSKCRGRGYFTHVVPWKDAASASLPNEEER